MCGLTFVSASILTAVSASTLTLAFEGDRGATVRREGHILALPKSHKSQRGPTGLQISWPNPTSILLTSGHRSWGNQDSRFTLSGINSEESVSNGQRDIEPAAVEEIGAAGRERRRAPGLLGVLWLLFVPPQAVSDPVDVRVNADPDLQPQRQRINFSMDKRGVGADATHVVTPTAAGNERHFRPDTSEFEELVEIFGHFSSMLVSDFLRHELQVASLGRMEPDFFDAFVDLFDRRAEEGLEGQAREWQVVSQILRRGMRHRIFRL